MGGVTTRLALRYPNLTDTADVPRDITNLANDIDVAVVYIQGAQSARPPSASGTPGIAGRLFYNTDTGISTGDLQFDFGQGFRKIASYKTDGNLDHGATAEEMWTPDTVLHRTGAGVLQTDGLFKALKGIYGGELTSTQRDALPAGARPRGTVIFNTDNTRLEVNVGSDATPSWAGVGSGAAGSGTLSAMPAYNAVNAPSIYYATDQDVTYINIGTAWQRSGAQPGDLFLTLNTVASPGRVLLTGQAWPGTTGIYAALYAKWSAAFPGNLPDWQGRMPVILGPNAEVNGIGKVEAGALAAANRKVTHKSSVADPGHLHPVAGGSTTINGGGDSPVIGSNSVGDHAGTRSTTTGITVGPQATGPTDGSAFFTCQIEAKL